MIRVQDLLHLTFAYALLLWLLSSLPPLLFILLLAHIRNRHCAVSTFMRVPLN